jgi:AraC-like DNA-binding protein
VLGRLEFDIKRAVKAGSRVIARRQVSGVETFLEGLREFSTGLYIELPPSPDVRRFVACGWIKVVRQTGELTPVIPDGCADIITHNDGPPLLIGPDDVTRCCPHSPGLVITGLRLRPGAARTVFGCAAGELLGKTINLSDISRDARGLHRELNGLHAPSTRLAALENWVRRRLERSAHRDIAVTHACRIMATERRITMDAIASMLGWNVRTLHREFIATCGYGPKYMHRILRVQAVIRAANSGARPRLTELANQFEFADQAHMTREFRSITGFKPSAYLTESDVDLGRWLHEDWTERQLREPLKLLETSEMTNRVVIPPTAPSSVRAAPPAALNHLVPAR